MNTIITLTETRFYKKINTKTTYLKNSEEVKQITEKQHELYFSSVKFFRKLGGVETVEKSYTCMGYVGTKLTSTSPDKLIKVVREFKFKSVPLPVNYDFENLSLYGKYHSLVGRGLMNDELREKLLIYKANNENFEYLKNEFNKLNTL